jgi:hypothetical protein
MADRGNSTKNHKDHVHVLFFDGSYSAPVVSKPVQAPDHVTEDGVLGPKTIALWQKLMATPVDGVISHPQSELVRRVQWRLRSTVDHSLPITKNGINQDGKVSRTVFALQRYLKVPVDGKLDKGDSRTVRALQRRLNTGQF